MDDEADGARERRGGGPLWDPVAGMRAMADIQAEGLRAAGELLDRVLERDRDTPPPPEPSAQGEYAALIDAWAMLLQRFAGGLAAPVGEQPATVAIDSATVGPPVRIELDGGESTVAEIWLHNGKGAPAGPLALRCGPLSAADGSELDGTAVQFEPREVEQLPARSSRGVLVSLRPGERVRPGTYRGTIQADGAPALWLPLEVAVS